MKKIFAVLMLLAMVSFPIAAMSAGAGVFTQQATLVSASTGTTAAKLYTFTFDYPVSKIACDFVTGMSTTTIGPTYVVTGNQGSSTTLFDTGANGTLVSSVTSSPVSMTTSTMLTRFGTADHLFRTVSLSVTSPTMTNTHTVNCSVSQ